MLARWAWAVFATCLFLCLGFGGCTSNSSIVPAPSQLNPVNVGLPAVTELLDLAHAPSAMEPVPASGFVESGGEVTQLVPDGAVLNSQNDTPAWARYEVDASGLSGVHNITVEFCAAERYWLGVADFARGTWCWHLVPGAGTSG